MAEINTDCSIVISLNSREEAALYTFLYKVVAVWYAKGETVDPVLAEFFEAFGIPFQ